MVRHQHVPALAVLSKPVLWTDSLTLQNSLENEASFLTMLLIGGYKVR
jgi:hypothetical protein